jgi:hypothetical protein
LDRMYCDCLNNTSMSFRKCACWTRLSFRALARNCLALAVFPLLHTIVVTTLLSLLEIMHFLLYYGQLLSHCVVSQRNYVLRTCILICLNCLPDANVSHWTISVEIGCSLLIDVLKLERSHTK